MLSKSRGGITLLDYGTGSINHERRGLNSTLFIFTYKSVVGREDKNRAQRQKNTREIPRYVQLRGPIFAAITGIRMLSKLILILIWLEQLADLLILGKN